MRKTLVLGDRVQLQQVVLNIVLNAIDVMTDSNEKELCITTRNENDQVLVAVRDTGCGIDPSTIEAMFEPFYSTKPGGHGYGTFDQLFDHPEPRRQFLGYCQ